MDVVLKSQSVWQKAEMIMWFGVGLDFPPSFNQTNDCVSTLSKMTQLGHQKGGASEGVLWHPFGKSTPYIWQSPPATVASPLQPLSNTDLTVCKAVLENWGKVIGIASIKKK